MSCYENRVHRKLGSDKESMCTNKNGQNENRCAESLVPTYCTHLVIGDVIISFDSSVNGEKRSLESFSDCRVEIASFLFAHVKYDVRRIVNTAGGAILLDIFIQNRHFLIGFFEKRKRFIKRDYTASMG